MALRGQGGWKRPAGGLGSLSPECLPRGASWEALRSPFKGHGVASRTAASGRRGVPQRRPRPRGLSGGAAAAAALTPAEVQASGSHLARPAAQAHLDPRTGADARQPATDPLHRRVLIPSGPHGGPNPGGALERFAGSGGEQRLSAPLSPGWEPQEAAPPTPPDWPSGKEPVLLHVMLAGSRGHARPALPGASHAERADPALGPRVSSPQVTQGTGQRPLQLRVASGCWFISSTATTHLWAPGTGPGWGPEVRDSTTPPPGDMPPVWEVGGGGEATRPGQRGRMMMLPRSLHVVSARARPAPTRRGAQRRPTPGA